MNGNVVALADQHGRLAAQYTYEPDGRLRSAEIPAAPATGPPPAPGEWPATIAAARLNRLGFQGLWAERIDVEGATTDTPTAGLDPLGISDATAWPAAPGPIPLLGGSPRDTHELLYFARNRFYSPSLNRWTHADPNALGVPVLDALWWGGDEPWSPGCDADLITHYADGLNVHAAFRGNPLSISDPLGLFGIVDIGFGSSSMADLYADQADRTMSMGRLIQERAGRMLADAAFDQLLDFYWASDWDAPDDLYRGSTSWASRTGSWATGNAAASPGSASMLDPSGPAMSSNYETDALEHAKSNAGNRARGLGVYFVYDEAGNIIYAGRSSNMNKRMHESMRRVGGVSVAGFAMTDRSAVRALEHVAIRDLKLIENGRNINNGISARNPKRNRYFNALEQFVATLR